MYTYEKFNVRLFPWFLLVIAVVFTFSGMYIGAAISGIPGAVTAFSWTGFNIDPETKRIRQFDRFTWFYIGSWKPIPQPLYVTVVRIRVSGVRNLPIPMATAQEGSSSTTYKLNLVINSRERYIPLARGKRMIMLEEGLKIAKLLNIRLLDHTTSEKHWLV